MNPLPPSVVELDGPFEHEFLHTRGIRLHAVTAGNPDDPLVLYSMVLSAGGSTSGMSLPRLPTPASTSPPRHARLWHV